MDKRRRTLYILLGVCITAIIVGVYWLVIR